jgi:hypothetical protein
MLKSDMFDVVALMDPHVPSGIHLMVALADAPRRPWRDLGRALQGMAIAEQTAQLLEQNTFEGKPIAATTSVRATGSWFGGFSKLKERMEEQNEVKRRRDQSFLQASPKTLKRHFRGATTKLGQSDEWTMGLLGFHPHIYGAKDPGEAISLTQRPKNEGGADWEGIKPLPEAERRKIRDILNKDLVPTLIPLVKGSIRTESIVPRVQNAK